MLRLLPSAAMGSAWQNRQWPHSYDDLVRELLDVSASIAEGLPLEEAIELLKWELRKLGPARRAFVARRVRRD